MDTGEGHPHGQVWCTGRENGGETEVQAAGRAPEWGAPAGNRSGLRLNNSLSHGKGLVDFVPIDGNAVKWYTCGPTVSDPPHLGNGRTYLTFDILRRIMEDYFQYSVTFAMGITDIDDKIIIRTRQLETLVREGWAWRDAEQSLAEMWGNCICAEKALNQAREWLQEHCLKYDGKDAFETIPRTERSGCNGNLGLDTMPLTREMETRFFRDMARLGIKPPTVITRVSEYIPSIISFVSKIIENGCAYEHAGNVYFSIESFVAQNHTYAKLMPCSAEDTCGVLTGNCEGPLCTSDEGRRHPKDFMLWKKSSDGDPRWKSPWGEGRPGWHIECSAMASEVLGKQFDIHSGGEDLKFPHHDNELAQSEARWEHNNWVNYFIHHGHLHIDGRNMPNNLKNCVSIEGALEVYSSKQIRMLLLLHPYDGPIMFSQNSMTVAMQQLEIFTRFFSNLEHLLDHSTYSQAMRQDWDKQAEQVFSDEFDELRNNIHNALCQNFDTPTVMALMKEIVHKTQSYINTNKASGRTVRRFLIQQPYMYIKKMFKVFGLMDHDSASFTTSEAARAFKTEAVTKTVDALLEFKAMVKQQLSASLSSNASPGDLRDAIDKLCSDLTENTLPSIGIHPEDRGCLRESWTFSEPYTHATPPERFDDSKIAVLARLPTLPPLDD